MSKRLQYVLDAAFIQATEGKGKARHANGKPFERQPMQDIINRQGLGFPLGQCDKKVLEARRWVELSQRDKAVDELLGAIVYIAGAVIWIEDNPEITYFDVDAHEEPSDVEGGSATSLGCSAHRSG